MTPTRRHIIGMGAGGLTGALMPALSPAAATPPPIRTGLAIDPSTVIETGAGRVRGYRSGEVLVFKGIPYAATTEGDARFASPAPMPKWAGVRSSMAYGPVCPQPARRGWRNDEEAFLFHWDDGFAGEDCLRLNVWTRPRAGQARMPVMVWLHGGGYTAGSSQELPAYDGERMAANHGVVLVSVNHRLGPLGYLDLSEIGGERLRHSGNAGMLDIVAALQWVRDNIVAFGGDPGNVTIFGQSGGGSKVTTLMAMPSARGLFHKAIVQSGSFPLSATTETARRFAAEVLHEAGVDRDLARLQRLPAAALIEAGARVQSRGMPNGPDFGAIGGPRLRLPGWSPVVDGEVVTDAPGLAHDVPLIVGSTRDEFGGAIGDLTGAELLGRMTRLDPARRGLALAAFRAAFPDLSLGELARVMAASSLRSAAIEQAAVKTQAGGAPAFHYWLTFPCQTMRWGAFHCYDLPFCFDNVTRWATATGDTPAARRLGAVMSTVWARFAATGDPSQPGLRWPRFDPATVPTMVFDARSRVELDPAGVARRLLERT